jgi:hypothetical protein
MGLFDRSLAELRAIERRWEHEGVTRLLPRVSTRPWRAPPQVVLRQETGLELGNPSVASGWGLMIVGAEQVRHGRVTLVGPEFREAPPPGYPFALLVLAGGACADPHELYREVRQAVDGVRLEGLTMRRLPSQQCVWCRISRSALARGFNAALLGSAVVEAACAVDAAEAAEVLMVTGDRERVMALLPVAERAGQVASVLGRINDRLLFDCDGCDLKPVCDSVSELRALHRRVDTETR